MLETGKCPKGRNCEFAHFPNQIEMKNYQSQLNTLNKAIVKCTQKMIDSEPFKPFVPVGSKDTIENMTRVRFLEE